MKKTGSFAYKAVWIHHHHHHHHHHIRLINDLSPASITQHKTQKNIQWQWQYKKTNVVGPILLKTLTLFVQLKNRAKKAYV